MIHTGDCRTILRNLLPQSVHTCVTSPPYFGLRDYGTADQIGLEQTPQDYIAALVAVFAEVHRVLRDDGTLWVNIGDSYASYRDGKATPDTTRNGGTGTLVSKGKASNRSATTFVGTAIKHKDLIGIPWRLAFALQDAGWYLRQDIIWHKPNPMPESVKDRCTKAHEYIFLLAKQPRYYFDHVAMQEPAVRGACGSSFVSGKTAQHQPNASTKTRVEDGSRNRRSVWSVNTKPFKGAHFATFPATLIEPCVLAGCPVGGTVLDPFFGSGTTGLVAQQHGRNYVGVESNPEYVKIAKQRLGLHTRCLFDG